MAEERQTEAGLRAELEALRHDNACLRAELERLQKLNKAADQFISRIGHDLRTPLANITLYTALLKKGNPEKREEYQQVLAQQTARLEKMLDELLDIARLVTGETEFHFAQTDLNLLMTGWRDEWQSTADARGLKLILDLAPDLPAIMADPAQLKQAAAHILKNALDYTPPAGHIICRTMLHRAPEQSWVILSVENSGLGLAEDEIAHMGERFYRGRAARHYKVEGAGLGVAICQEIVTQHGGQLTVDSQPGSSATFAIWLKPSSNDQ